MIDAYNKALEQMNRKDWLFFPGLAQGAFKKKPVPAFMNWELLCWLVCLY